MKVNTRNVYFHSVCRETPENFSGVSNTFINFKYFLVLKCNKYEYINNRLI